MTIPTIPNYLASRQSAVPQADNTAFNARLDAVVKTFGADWLGRDHSNPAQALWSRKDAQSTNELLLLGDAIVNLSTADARWVERQVDLIKEGDAGTRAGALFELLGLNLFHASGQQVLPAGANNPGYDGSVVLDDGSSLMLSIKNHGISSKELEFRSKAEQAKNAFVELCEARRQRAFVRILATKYPSDADWDRLRNDLPAIVQAKPPSGETFWSGWVQDIPGVFHPLSPTRVSYLFEIAAAYHPNEQKNFFENIRKGIANLEKHQSLVPARVCRALLLRLSANALIADCVEWAKWYLGENPDTAVELILLYQAVPAMLDLAHGISGITHCVVPVEGPRYQAWRRADPRRHFTLRTLIGSIIAKPTRMVMTDSKGGNRASLKGMYVYQRGDIYRFYPGGPAPISANLSTPAPGILIHADIEGLGALQIIAPSNPELLLLP
jgi:hypothetical protein